MEHPVPDADILRDGERGGGAAAGLEAGPSRARVAEEPPPCVGLVLQRVADDAERLFPEPGGDAAEVRERLAEREECRFGGFAPNIRAVL